jgi:hypothetical protein
MGDAAEDVLDGLMCQGCGELIDGDAPGWPRTCDGCRGVGDRPAARPATDRRRRRRGRR